MSLADCSTIPASFTPPPWLFNPTGFLWHAERSSLGEQKGMTQGLAVAKLTRSPRHHTQGLPLFLQTARSSGHPQSRQWHPYLYGSLYPYLRDETNKRSMARRDETTLCQASAERDVHIFGSGRGDCTQNDSILNLPSNTAMTVGRTPTHTHTRTHKAE